MSDTSPFGFGKFVPGFDFLQSLAKGASGGMPQLPSLSNWVAPTLSVDELEKRIGELKAVQFWLEQNSRALAATIQALEVQKMTLATLKGMNFSMGEVANAFGVKSTDTAFGGAQDAASAMTAAAEAMAGAAGRMAGHGADARPKHAASDDEPEASTTAHGSGREEEAAESKQGDASERASVIDPMQWWGALTSQFQQIAANALKDPATQTAIDSTRNMATGLTKEVFKTAGEMASQFTAASGKSKAPSARNRASAGDGSGQRQSARAPKSAAKPAAKKAGAAASRRSPSAAPSSSTTRARTSKRNSAG